MDNSDRFLKELGEYRLLWAGFKELHAKYEERKTRLCLLLEELEGLRRRTLRELGKAARFTKHLTPFQRNELGLLPGKGNVWFVPQGQMASSQKKQRELPSLDPASLPVPSDAYSNRRELKAGTLGLLSQIDALKKSLLQLNLLELRVRELLLSINKAMKAYAHEYRVVRRRIYPIFVLSALGKSWRRLKGMTYFTPRDIIELTVLGDIAVNIAGMTESPVLSISKDEIPQFF
ncbi:hypothetical protein [Leadbettera azotonutricia]|uniref:Uncharacterized protein n=1 Tax=Leadbettera azotonutricia (strain ATCC BAA-888 / DSM 13862 / ZAS-9) TaxID=545695 RepID=F5Y7J8_LEAAZ|nr:hypothetical protein [Leadbettera azotonutricia]AEF80368.1 hypothetical protein TREAZ_1080 [Leadbettera azotonutricia ZAS-9]